MLVEFNVTNYLSFKERATLSLVADSDTSLSESNVFDAEREKLLKSAVLYGANASGKSNLIRALNFMKDIVLSSSKTQEGDAIRVDSFLLSSETAGLPSTFEVSFIQDRILYRYGFEVDRKSIKSEWLYMSQSAKAAELFTRESGKISVNTAWFKEGKDLDVRTRDNALFLSVCAQFNGDVSKIVVKWFQNLRFVSGLSERVNPRGALDRLTTPEAKRGVMELARIADLGIEDMISKQQKLTVEMLPPGMPQAMKDDILKDGASLVELKTKHRMFNADKQEIGLAEFDLDDNESGGTQKIIGMAGALLGTVENGEVLMIDELDARLHPLLTQAIVSLFNSGANRSAQLVCATHDTTLLTNKLLRRDQIWFTEKDEYGATALYSLAELKGVRKEAVFSKDYILGKYGAIPFIGDARALFAGSAHA